MKTKLLSLLTIVLLSGLYVEACPNCFSHKKQKKEAKEAKEAKSIKKNED